MEYYTKENARKDYEAFSKIKGEDYQITQLMYVLDSIKERANSGKEDLVYLVYDSSGRVLEWSESFGGIPFYLDFIKDSLSELGYSVEISGRYLCVNWK